MFGKSLSDYVAFQKPILILIAIVWALRLGLSMAGVPLSGAQFVSVTGVLVLGVLSTTAGPSGRRASARSSSSTA
jgi:hypothetical protein